MCTILTSQLSCAFRKKKLMTDVVDISSFENGTNELHNMTVIFTSYPENSDANLKSVVNR